MKVLIFSHGHPQFSKGGGEYAAYYLYQGVNATKDHEAWFAARAPRDLLHFGTPVSALSSREYLVEGEAGMFDLSTTLALDDDSYFVNMLKKIQPDIVHFHHYFYLGLELIQTVKRVLPETKIVMTLHEYIAICNHNGQMIKKDLRLCYQYSPRECVQCFPELTSESFFLREQYIKTFFALVDVFISPSYFLRDRYTKWGLAKENIKVIENGLPEAQKLPPRLLHDNEVRGRFAYFGQITPFKGLDLIIKAFARLPEDIKKQTTLDIYGAGMANWPEYEKKLIPLLESNKEYINFHGAYESHELPDLMAEIDWVVMGSIWWENSPLVIQEAFKYGRPLICPDLGGMAEKVQDGISGLHYRPRDPVSLSSVFKKIIDGNVDYDGLYKQLPASSTIKGAVASHLGLYETL